MGEALDKLNQRIAEIEAQLRLLNAAPQSTAGVTVGGSSSVYGPILGTNLGTVIYNHDPSVDQREQLVRYLVRLAAKMQHCLLSGLIGHDLDGMALAQTSGLMATTTLKVFARGPAAALQEFCSVDPAEQAVTIHVNYRPETALPHAAILRTELQANARELVLWRASLATEAVSRYRRLVLLSEPGGGKSSFLRYLAWVLAQHSLGLVDPAAVLPGWTSEHAKLPLVLPLVKLARRIARDGATIATVSAAIRDEMTSEYDARHADDVLDQALAHQAVLLLFDGLDEVPQEELASTAGRAVTLQLVRDFAALHAGNWAVITCRMQAYDAQLKELLSWHVQTLAPLTLAQIRHFIAAWYREAQTSGTVSTAQTDALQTGWSDQVAANPKLAAMARTPLLLSMMLRVQDVRGSVPHDRVLLFEALITHLLADWERYVDGVHLAEFKRKGRDSYAAARDLLDELAFQAHRSMGSPEVANRLAAASTVFFLASRFKQMGMPSALETAERYLEFLIEWSGLLMPAGDGLGYTFAHVALQEFCAGRHLVLQPSAVQTIMQFRHHDHWHEPIALGLGVIHRQHPEHADRLDRVLTELIDRDEAGVGKTFERWYCDLVFAGELGFERDWTLLQPLVNISRVQRELRRGLVTLLSHVQQPLPVAERVHAAQLLARLDDPRTPVTLAAWQSEIERAVAGAVDGYFCRINAGGFIIGSASSDVDADAAEMPQHMVAIDRQFLIARFPITNAQFQAWLSAENIRPPRSLHDQYLNPPNHPVVGVSWFMCVEFCQWLSSATGWTVRLPSEYEWEAAARGADGRRYPWGNQRVRDRAAIKEDQPIRSAPFTTPVGCYPAGASPCGALDMSGNVWEWTADVWRSYPGATASFEDREQRVLRGGAYRSKKRHIRCAVRVGRRPAATYDNGFRIVLVLPEP